MYSIDEIISMLDGNNPPEIQEKGRRLAREVKCINVFIRPLAPYGKKVWENCAEILCEKSDDELSNYYFRLLEWLQDMNWPGAICVYSRLVKCQYEYFDNILDRTIFDSKLLNDNIWYMVLTNLKSDRQKMIKK